MTDRQQKPVSKSAKKAAARSGPRVVAVRHRAHVRALRARTSAGGRCQPGSVPGAVNTSEQEHKEMPTRPKPRPDKGETK